MATRWNHSATTRRQLAALIAVIVAALIGTFATTGAIGATGAPSATSTAGAKPPVVPPGGAHQADDRVRARSVR